MCDKRFKILPCFRDLKQQSDGWCVAFLLYRDLTLPVSLSLKLLQYAHELSFPWLSWSSRDWAIIILLCNM